MGVTEIHYGYTDFEFELSLSLRCTGACYVFEVWVYSSYIRLGVFEVNHT